MLFAICNRWPRQHMLAGWEINHRFILACQVLTITLNRKSHNGHHMKTQSSQQNTILKYLLEEKYHKQIYNSNNQALFH
jgi:hypothetical protein